MKQFLMRNFALTDQGAKGVFKAGMASFAVFVINLCPAFILMFWLDQLLFNHARSTGFYLCAAVLTLVVMFFLLNREYDLQYNDCLLYTSPSPRD